MSCTHHRSGREVTYLGTREDDGGTAARTIVTVQDNVTRQVDSLVHHVKHSPSGFAWGYLGSGPAELARCILWDHLGAEPTPALYQAFKELALGPDADGDEIRIGTYEIVGFIDRYHQDYPKRPLVMDTVAAGANG